MWAGNPYYADGEGNNRRTQPLNARMLYTSDFDAHMEWSDEEWGVEMVVIPIAIGAVVVTGVVGVLVGFAFAKWTQ